MMDTLTMNWHDRDGRWYGYDPDLPGGAHVYKDDSGNWRVKTLVNGAVIADVDLPGYSDLPIDRVLGAAYDTAVTTIDTRRVSLALAA